MDLAIGVNRPRVNSVAVELTAVCNQRCDYCYNEWREDGGKQLGGPEVDVLLQRVTRLIDAWEIDHFTLTGGEPLTHPGFFPLARLIRERGIRLQVISNGTLVTDKVAQELAPLRLRFIQLTLNGPDEALHAAHVGKGFFAKTLAGVRRLREHQVPVVGCIVITKKNASLVDQILELWRSLGVNAIALSRFSPAGYASRHVAQLLPTVEELTRAFELANPFGQADAFGQVMRLHCTMPVPPCSLPVERFTHIKFGVCPIGTAQQEFALGPDGRLRNCTLHGEAIGAVQDVGNPEVDLRALLLAKEITEYRKLRPDFCNGCRYVDSCAGGCGAASQWVFGTRRRVDPLVEQHVEDEFHTALATFRRSGKTHLEVIA